MSDWHNYKLDDVIAFNPKQALKKGELAKKVPMEALVPFQKKIKKQVIEIYSGGVKFSLNDTLLARITPSLENGKTAFVDFLNHNESGFGSTEFIVLRAITGRTDPHFVYYLATSPAIRELAIKSMTGTSGRQRVQEVVLRNHITTIPPIQEQQAIAEVLSSIDDKIDLLNRQNETLEALAQTLFRQWFIEEADDSWEELPITSVAHFLNGLACQKFPPLNDSDRLPVLKIRDLKDGLSDTSDYASRSVDPKYIIDRGDVIFSWSASLVVKFWNGDKCVLNQHLFKVTSELYPKWFYYFWCKHHLTKFIAVANAHATTMGHIKRSDLDNAMVIVPDQAELNRMSSTMDPIIEKLLLNSSQISSLRTTRDTLLPKLMSGEVRVKLN